MQYHNTTCHYNVWWNGNESLKEGVEKLTKSSIDDYTQILPVYKLGTETESRAVYPQMDRAIEKGIKGITEHSIFIKGEEHVPYIRECYLLTAYATFYKRDYASTVNTCQILANQFAGTRAGDEGAILRARCLSMEGQYTEAEANLDALLKDLEKGGFSSSEREKLYLAMVEACLPQQKYKKAVQYIKEALNVTSSSQTKARLNFIMAQVYQKLDKRPVAAKYYDKVLTYGPDYVMEFNAKINAASCADLQHSDVGKLEKLLDQMLADKKNEEFRDQIYYAKGEMYMGLKDAKKACDNYRLSVAAATQNMAQKAKSAVRLGEVLYDVYEDYTQAQLYYDTAVQIIDKTYPNYRDIKNRYDLLSSLVAYTSVYERNDSLIAIAALPEADRRALIEQKIETLKQEEEAAKERELLEQMINESKAQTNTLVGDWYFYNANTVQKGKDTFRQRWGMRVLEDNWFLSHKAMLSTNLFADMSEEEESSEEGADSTAVADSTKKVNYGSDGNPNDPHSVAYYTKDLPTTQAQLDSMDYLTAISLLNAGYIFYDGLGNTPRALECYLRMANDYTGYDEVVQAFYMLHRIYSKQGNTPSANYYRDMVLMGFPDSDFANMLRDEEYYKQIINRDQEIKELYADVYNLYRRRRYRDVIDGADVAINKYANDPLLPKFQYWKGLAYAHLGSTAEAVNTLQAIVDSRPKTDTIVILAEAQLAILKADSNYDYASSETIISDDETTGKNADIAASITPKPISGGTIDEEDELPEEARLYRYREKQQHYVVIILNDKRINATEMQYKVVDFNSLYYSNMGYKANAALFTDTMQIITVHRFVTAAEAMNYYKHITQADGPLKQYNSADYTVFPISTQNYATFYNRKNLDAYEAFFRKYYK
ncbi:MAG: tetratricopeptide repeat protein [Bacteroidales bacterium]|nr:tetratricopeptide repeat protein [Bacteroidales bacterium]